MAANLSGQKVKARNLLNGILHCQHKKKQLNTKYRAKNECWEANAKAID